jgi:hypothetical protein
MIPRSPVAEVLCKPAVSSPPVCPTCGQPASEALGGPEHDWECRNEACPEFGQPLQADEPSRDDDEVGDADLG